jgi:hypothetical protein
MFKPFSSQMEVLCPVSRTCHLVYPKGLSAGVCISTDDITMPEGPAQRMLPLPPSAALLLLGAVTATSSATTLLSMQP